METSSADTGNTSRSTGRDGTGRPAGDLSSPPLEDRACRKGRSRTDGAAAVYSRAVASAGQLRSLRERPGVTVNRRSLSSPRSRRGSSRQEQIGSELAVFNLQRNEH
ncbi:hypothetical protein PF010_g21626 [Phytophthora fragariae]|uniref:Uncharacterized protein n=1 Tax=Phytophthora fragariae TaxID=53985 RepID=A0A6G0KAS1_9STRA|nr:hypothetical protein PF010_g21626 [Phytophthora fragariae]KAE9193037.1 hypothetical protein PF004_g21139 [Phytophthora fragariae]